MTILSFQIDSVGQSGVVPKIIQINTNNTVSQVLQTGFLNGLVSQGIPLSETDMALVSTTPTPEATSYQVSLFNIVQSGSNWSLTQYSTGLINSGLNLGSGTAIYAGVSGNSLQFNSLVAGTGITLSSAAGNITITSTGTFSPANPYTWTGAQYFTGGFEVNNTSSIDFSTTSSIAMGAATYIEMVGGFVNITSSATSGYIDLVASYGNITLQAEDGSLLLAATGSINFVNGVGTLTGQVAASPRIPPATYNYLIINGSGELAQFAA